jgi:hypothetical protein
MLDSSDADWGRDCSPDGVEIRVHQLPAGVKILNSELFLVVAHQCNLEAAPRALVLFLENQVVTAAKVFVLSLQVPRWAGGES